MAKKDKYRKGLFAALLLSLLWLASAIILPHAASAFSLFTGDPGTGVVDTTSPQANSGRYNPTSLTDPNSGLVRTPYYVIGNADGNYTYSDMELNLYVDKNKGGSFTVNISNAGPACYNINSAGLTGPDYTQTGSPPIVQYSVRQAGGGVANGGTAIARPTGCSTQAFTVTINPNTAIDMTTPVRDFNAFYVLRAEITGGGQGENSFRTAITSTNNNAVVGLVGGAGKYAGYGYRDENLNNGNYWNAPLVFAPVTDCSELLSPNKVKTGSVSFQDIDPPGPSNNLSPGNQWNPLPRPNMTLYQQLVNPDGSVTGNNWTIVTNSSGQLQSFNGFTLPQNGQFNFSDFKVGYRYKVVMSNFGVRNTVRINLDGAIAPIFGTLSERPTINTCFQFSCTTVPASQTGMTLNQAVQIKVTAKNIGNSGWDPSGTPTIKMQKNVSGVISSLNLSQSTSGGSVVNPGGSTVFTFNATAPSGTNSSKFLIFSMYIGSTKMPGSNCQTVLSTGNCPATGCGGPSTSPSITADCSQTTVTVPKSSILATYHPPGSLVGVKITSVPIQMTVTDADTGTGLGSTTASVTVDVPYHTSTFGLVPGMWPHKHYAIMLTAQGTTLQDSLTYDNKGSWGPPWYTPVNFNTTDPVGDCLHVTSCTSPATADLEPGQTTTLSAGVNYTNDTQETYQTNSTGGYYFHVDAGGGIISPPGDPAPSSGAISPGSSSVNAAFSTRIDYSGTYSVTFMFQGSPLDLGQGVPCQSETVTPATKPFLQVWGGDVNTGGGFEQLNTSTGAFSCSNSYPGYVSPSTGGGDINYGGIKTFGYTDATGTFGSLSDFGALSLGQIATNSSAKVGFNASPKFANTVSPGGLLNSSPPDYCVQDFYDKTQKTPSPLSISPPAQLSSLSGSPTDQYIVSQNVDNFGGGVVPSGRKITLYVNGDVTITSNIIYANWDPANPDSAPSFSLIVKGNINISPNVTRIDGLYIAQPSSPGQDGSFNTCANNTGNQFCNQQFVANGAVIARVIMPLRSVGTVSQDANPAFNPAPGHVPAEIFNYIPSMIVSAPNFSPAYNPLQGLFNLPPVF